MGFDEFNNVDYDFDQNMYAKEKYDMEQNVLQDINS